MTRARYSSCRTGTTAMCMGHRHFMVTAHMVAPAHQACCICACHCIHACCWCTWAGGGSSTAMTAAPKGPQDKASCSHCQLRFWPFPNSCCVFSGGDVRGVAGACCIACCCCLTHSTPAQHLASPVCEGLF